MATEPPINDDPYKLAIADWRSRSVLLLPPAINEEIESAFARVNYPLSDDVRRLYLATSGFAEGELDQLWRLWSLDQLVLENENRKSDNLWFADWLISSHVYAFRYINPALSAVFIDYNSLQHPPVQIANDLSEFLGKYVRDPEGVQVWEP